MVATRLFKRGALIVGALGKQQRSLGFASSALRPGHTADTAKRSMEGLKTTVPLQSGLGAPAIGLGTWKQEHGQVQEAVKHAIRRGYVHIDCAKEYENQSEIGEGIQAALKEGALRREDLWIVSKLWCADLHPERVEEALQETLDQLKVSYLDQWLIHWPIAFERREPYELKPKNEDGSMANVETDLVGVWKKMEEAVDAKKVRSIGVSNCGTEELTLLLDNCRIRPDVNQLECHPYFNNNELKKFGEDRGIKLVSYSPIGRKGSKDEEESPLPDPVIKNIAAKHKKSPGQVVIRWHLQRGEVCVPKASDPQHIDENADVFDFELSNDDMKEIEELGKKNERMNNPPYKPGGQPAWG